MNPVGPGAPGNPIVLGGVKIKASPNRLGIGINGILGDISNGCC